MKKEKFEIGKAPHVTIECMGDLDVRSWGETAVYFKGDQYETTEQEDGIAIHSHGDLRVMLPAAAQLTVTAAHGDLIATARDDAQLILARDPDLASPRGQALRLLLYLFERDEAIRLLAAG